MQRDGGRPRAGRPARRSRGGGTAPLPASRSRWRCRRASSPRNSYPTAAQLIRGNEGAGR